MAWHGGVPGLSVTRSLVRSFSHMDVVCVEWMREGDEGCSCLPSHAYIDGCTSLVRSRSLFLSVSVSLSLCVSVSLCNACAVNLGGQRCSPVVVLVG